MASRRILHSIEVCGPQNVPAICLSWVAHAGHVAKMLPASSFGYAPTFHAWHFAIREKLNAQRMFAVRLH